VAPYPDAAMRHLAAPVGGGRMEAPDAVGEAGSASCGDLVRLQLRIDGGHVREARFLAFGCGAATAAASAACARLRGRPLLGALSLSAEALDADLGGLEAARRHGPELVMDALSRALEGWYSARLGSVGIPLSAGRVAVAMSGGVDSAVAAMLLRDAGLDVVGVTMRLWHDPAAAAAERSCCSPETVRLARASAHALGIPHLTLDAAERFRRGVVEEFVTAYRAGLTPNPCVTCNGDVRFRLLAEAAALVGARGLASGHYARLERSRAGRALVACAADAAKDQSYMLARLPAPLLARMTFPLGGLPKAEVRRMARAARLPAADAVESQEVCFVGAGGYAAFLEGTGGLSALPGPIVDAEGRRLGTHRGHWRYTVGQRRGLGLSGAAAAYVLAVDAARNTVTVGPREALAPGALRLESPVVHEELDAGGGPLEVRVRYRGGALSGRAAHGPDGALEVALAEPARGVAAAPGQTAALYRDGRLVAAGTIATHREG
jgi:tRNA-uridine 2-sulfurtransferase